MSNSNLTTDIIITMPQHFVQELDGLIAAENVNRSEFIYQATKSYLRDKKKKQVREAMKRGYLEMSKINLTIASESFLAEFEAENILKSRVSGG